MLISFSDSLKLTKTICSLNPLIVTNDLNAFLELEIFYKKYKINKKTHSSITTLKTSLGTVVYIPNVLEHLVKGRTASLIITKKGTTAEELHWFKNLEVVSPSCVLIQLA